MVHRNLSVSCVCQASCGVLTIFALAQDDPIMIFAGIKAEKEGLKASERSDAAVRDAADRVLHISDKAARNADRQSGGFFSGIGNWLRAR